MSGRRPQSSVVAIPRHPQRRTAPHGIPVLIHISRSVAPRRNRPRPRPAAGRRRSPAPSCSARENRSSARCRYRRVAAGRRCRTAARRCPDHRWSGLQ
ncbi:hypothetical protein CSE45_5315 [Citreicella sp. SE45]|nr:hypothetical protein CSE45_5315 [Citreicella sp. SE45]